MLGEVADEQTDEHSADDFATFFKEKVETVRATTAATPLYDVPFRVTPTMDELAPVTADDAID